MDRSEIVKQIKSYVGLAKSGFEIENPKLDFKANWYNLKDIKGINEFLKDTSAIANTFGPDGFIIIGYDEKSQQSQNSSFKDSGLSDTTYIIDLLNKKVDRLFYINIIEEEIEGNCYSIIHIPPSMDKPHVIRNYQIVDREGKVREEHHRIFIRRGTQTYPASKYDIELMYYDRKNITPEYKILSSFHHSSLYIGVYKNDERHHQVKGHIFLTIENAGTRPVSISRIDFELSIYDDPSDLEKLILSTDRLFNTQPIIIQPGHMANTKVEFFSKEFPPNHYPGPVDQIKQWSKSIVEKPLLLFLSHGEQILSDLKISKQ